MAVNGELDVAFSSPPEFGRIALAWLTEGVRFLAGGLSDAILAKHSPPRIHYVYDNPEENPTLVVPPMSGTVGVGYGKRKYYEKPYSRKSLRRLEALAPDCLGAMITLERQEEYGVREYHCLRVRREGEERGHARLMIEIAPASLRAADCPEVLFMRDFAQRQEPAFGHVSPQGNGVIGATQLELALGRTVADSLAAWDRYLRGYSWVTVIPEVLAARLGGADGLRAAGAFAQVEVVAGGSVWLQATPRWNQYGQEHTDRVLAALAPVLPPGTPRS